MSIIPASPAVPAASQPSPSNPPSPELAGKTVAVQAVLTLPVPSLTMWNGSFKSEFTAQVYRKNHMTIERR